MLSADTTLDADVSVPYGDGLLSGAAGITVELAGDRIRGLRTRTVTPAARHR